MNIIYNITLIYGLAFIIGLFVAVVIWVLYISMTAKGSKRIIHRESYNEMKRLKNPFVKSVK